MALPLPQNDESPEKLAQNPLIQKLRTLRGQAASVLQVNAESSDKKNIEKLTADAFMSLYRQTEGKISLMGQLVCDFSQNEGRKPSSWLDFPETLLRAVTLIGMLLESHHAMRTQGAVLLNQSALDDAEAPKRLAHTLQIETELMERFHQRLADLFICLFNTTAALGIDVSSNIHSRMVAHEMASALKKSAPGDKPQESTPTDAD